MQLWQKIGAALKQTWKQTWKQGHGPGPGSGQASQQGAAALRPRALPPQGIAVFAHTGEVIRAENALRDAEVTVEVKGPPPHLRTGCDMVIVYPLLQELRVREVLLASRIELVDMVSFTQGLDLLEPVSLFQVKDLGQWLMVRAANMKITVDKDTGRIVNISGGGCPDVPYLAACLTGLTLSEAQEPRRLGQTLCCYALQKAFEEARRLLPACPSSSASPNLGPSLEPNIEPTGGLSCG